MRKILTIEVLGVEEADQVPPNEAPERVADETKVAERGVLLQDAPDFVVHELGAHIDACAGKSEADCGSGSARASRLSA